MKKVMFCIMVLMMFLNFGCLAQELTKDKLMKCEEGNYRPSSFIAKAMEKRGYNVEEITLEKDYEVCRLLVRARDIDTNKIYRAEGEYRFRCMKSCLSAGYNEGRCFSACFHITFLKG